MSKKKVKQQVKIPKKKNIAGVVLDEVTPKADEKETTEVEYTFGTKSRCPRCQSTNTKAYTTRKNVQYRRCQSPICRWKYVVIGTKV